MDLLFVCGFKCFIDFLFLAVPVHRSIDSHCVIRKTFDLLKGKAHIELPAYRKKFKTVQAGDAYGAERRGAPVGKSIWVQRRLSWKRNEREVCLNKEMMASRGWLMSVLFGF